METKPYLVQMTPKVPTGETAMLVLPTRKVLFSLKDTDPQELELDDATARQLAQDGYSVTPKQAPKNVKNTDPKE